MERSFGDARRLQQQVDEEVARAVREAAQQQPGIRVERAEARGYNSYRCGSPTCVLATSAQPAWSPYRCRGTRVAPLRDGRRCALPCLMAAVSAARTP